MRIGFIGLGHKGCEMAASLINAGHQVTVFNRTRSKSNAVAGDDPQGRMPFTNVLEGRLLDLSAARGIELDDRRSEG
jgi:6-phosphogluconate dehydrogenase (decarboxylating)